VDIKDIKAIIDLMKKNSITEFELEQQDSKLRLKRGLSSGSAVNLSDDVPMLTMPVPIATTSMPGVIPAAAAPAVPAATGEVDVKSPMIGTFYRSPSPEAASYVEVGTEVTPDTVVCII
jgi:acetyl-CoA carboxylase biotin carboxyl carrier protein